LKDFNGGGGGIIDILITLDVFFVMIIMCPSEESLKFKFDPVLELDCYE